MDHRGNGGTPTNTNSCLDPISASEDSEAARKRKRGEEEKGDVGEKEEEKIGPLKKREADKGAVLELLIEGRCGSAGQQQLQISGRETSCPEGNVRLRNGLQAKRTKKPPKILESYICKPNVRTYQRQARGGPLRGAGEGGPQHNTSSTPSEATADQRSGLDSVQTTSKQTATAASPPLAASLSSPLQPLSSSSTASATVSVPAVTNQGTKSAKQVS